MQSTPMKCIMELQLCFLMYLLKFMLKLFTYCVFTEYNPHYFFIISYEKMSDHKNMQAVLLIHWTTTILIALFISHDLRNEYTLHSEQYTWLHKCVHIIGVYIYIYTAVNIYCYHLDVILDNLRKLISKYCRIKGEHIVIVCSECILRPCLVHIYYRP